jgi:WhiB family redox-sensing transcriptional regulator
MAPLKDESWRSKARCAGEDTELFFPPRDKTQYKSIASQAKQLCHGAGGNTPCPVLNQCLWYAIDSDEVHGIWGGMSHRERNALVRKWRKNNKDSMTLKEYVMKYERGNNANSTKD